MNDFDELRRRALQIRQKYDELNITQRQNKWDVKDYAMGFVGDVGDLMKLIATKENVRRGKDVNSRMGHELADCLWSLLVIAEYYQVDLPKEFLRTMDYLEKKISKELAKNDRTPLAQGSRSPKALYE